MCIIAVIPKGHQLPNDTTISTMWKNNPDGAGIMYAHGGKVYIRKGFMHLEKFKKALKTIPDGAATVLHFRIATHGGISPEMCHPFPLSGNEKHMTAVNFTTTIGIAHNGIINIKTRKGMSDTAEYILSQLAPLSMACPHWYTDVNALRMVENAIQSRMAVLDATGEIVTIGNGWQEEDGILFSNSSYISWDKWDKWGNLDAEYYDEWGDDWDCNYDAKERLMPIYDEDCYLMAGGEFLEMEDGLAIDKDGCLYAYDPDYLAYVFIGDYFTINRHNGCPMRYDDAYATEENVLYL